MLNFLRGRASKRKLRMFAIACYRRLWHLLTDEGSRHVVDVVDRISEALASKSKRGAAEAEDGKEIYTDDFYAAIRWLNDRYDESIAKTLAFQIADAASNTLPLPAERCASLTVYCILKVLPDEASRENERLAQCRLLLDIFGNPHRPQSSVDPFWLSWNDGTIPKLAQAVYDDRSFDRLLILADALEEAGCINADILNHCRQPGEHVRGCWVVDLLLGKS